MSADYYQEIGPDSGSRQIPHGVFRRPSGDAGRYGNDHAHTVEYGIRCVKMDPIVVLTAMGMATEKLGLASTCSTTYYEPFDVARRFATLDLMTGGRAAWNVVTSVNDGEAHNMGKDAHLEHDLRYDRADEFHGSGARSLGLLGRRLAADRQEERPVCRSRQGQAPRSPREILQVRADRLRCRARNRVIPSSSRPAPAAAASVLPADGAK